MSNTEQPPVVLFAFNRARQLRETLQCLRQNNIPLLYVFADGARDARDKAGVEEVRRLVDEIDWTDVKRIYSDKNKGLSQSIQDGLQRVFEKHAAAVVLEDDVRVAPGFYSYMTACLLLYRDDERIAGITGLRYPFAKKHLSSDDADVFLAPRFSSWGWGTWQREWQQLSFDQSQLLGQLKRQKPSLTAGGTDLPQTVKTLEKGGLTGHWDVLFYINMVLKGQYFVWPKRNLVINTGITDGSHGDHTLELGWKLRWESGSRKTQKWQLPKQLEVNDSILADFRVFFEPSILYQPSTSRRLKNWLGRLSRKAA